MSTGSPPQSVPHQSPDDPFLDALAAAEYDDEPYTDEQRAAAEAGREAFQRGEFASLEAVWGKLNEEDNGVMR